MEFEEGTHRRGARSRRAIVGGLIVVALAAGLVVGALAGGALGSGHPSPDRSLVAASTPPASSSATAGAATTPSPSPIPTPSATSSAPPSPSPTPAPTPELVPAPLTGVLVTPEAAARHPIAVMVDDLSAARPQSGFSAASVVWHAPAEGGIPRYMLIFQENLPEAVGPVRSARYYYIAWAAEWRSVYVHVGGSPQALQTLQAKGRGQLVYNADEFRWGGRYLWRITQRQAPHNVYTDGKHLRALASVLKAPDGPLEPAWRFAPDAPLAERPIGGRIETGYRANHIRYDYDRKTNSYLRSVTGEKQQTDAANGQRVAPKNVVIMLVRFGRLNDGHPEKKRLEADVIGSGTAWIATGGRTIKGTWRKAALTSPTTFLDARGRPVTLTVGQTFVQVVETGSKVTIVAGKAPPVPRSLHQD